MTTLSEMKRASTKSAEDKELFNSISSVECAGIFMSLPSARQSQGQVSESGATAVVPRVRRCQRLLPDREQGGGWGNACYS